MSLNRRGGGMALSSRAHAFSVEALVGRSTKRKGADGGEEESGLACRQNRRVPEPGWYRWGPPPLLPQSHPPPQPQPTSLVVLLPFLFLAEKRPKTGTESREAGAGVQVELQGSELWRRFHEIGTEMIITKAGRYRMFPSVRVKVKGLEPLKQYYIAIDVVPVDSKRYRYVYHSSQWMVAGNTDHSCITPRLYIHPDSPCSGETWMRQIISFDRVKLTNNEMDDKGHVGSPIGFSFQETEFTTVTAYQN
uniref:T-box domain-containing protein n=1 Tax=Accipiter nisus TaxID=211598 RepID=A0A8B9MTF1_9AVES